MKQMKIVLALVSPLSDIIGILAFLGASRRSIETYITHYVTDWRFWFVFVPSIIVLIKIIITRIGDMGEIYEEERANEDMDRISSGKYIGNIRLALPKTATLVRLYKKLETRIKGWADDALIKSINLYVECANKSWIKPTIQVVAYSKWKNEEGCFYEGRSRSEEFIEGNRVHVGRSMAVDNLFFIINPQWQTLIIKAFDSVSSKITNSFKIAIQDETITIYFVEGKVSKTKRFKMINGYTELVPD